MDTQVTRIDRQAWAWREKLTKCWRGESIERPLPHDRLTLIKMATRRENPNRAAFLTLALVEWPEDLATLPIGERTAKLPYQLAWARAGQTLSERSGLPGGIVRARWPDVAPGAMSTQLAPPRAPAVRRQPVQPGERDGLLRQVRLDGDPDLPGRPDPTDSAKRPEVASQESIPGLGLDVVPSLPKRSRRAHYQRDTGATQLDLPLRKRAQS